MLNDIKPFDGKRESFTPWRHQIKQLEGTIPQDRLLQIIKLKLGPSPAAFVQSLGEKQFNYPQLMSALIQQYDPVGDATVATTRWMRLQQGSKSITEHHNTVYSLLAAMDQSVATTDLSVKARYMQSLQDAGMRTQLHRKDQSNKTLQDLIEMTRREERVRMLASGTMPEEGTTPKVAEAASVECCEATPAKPGEKRKFNNPAAGEKMYCGIHLSFNHWTKDCRARNDKKCRRCGTEVEEGELENHMKVCPKVGKKCFNCDEMGHIARFCPHKDKRARREDSPDRKGKSDRHSKHKSHKSHKSSSKRSDKADKPGKKDGKSKEDKKTQKVMTVDADAELASASESSGSESD
jgi:hypothetical protein